MGYGWRYGMTRMDDELSVDERLGTLTSVGGVKGGNVETWFMADCGGTA